MFKLILVGNLATAREGLVVMVPVSSPVLQYIMYIRFLLVYITTACSCSRFIEFGLLI